MGDVFDSLFGSDTSTTISPFSERDYNSSIAPLIARIQGTDDQKGLASYYNPEDIIKSYRPNEQTLQSAGLLTGFSPESYFQGGKGGLGGVQSLLGQGQQLLTRGAQGLNQDKYGAGALFSRFLSPEYTNVTQDPQLNAALDAVAQRNQRFLNENADLVQGSAQRASGGVGQGTAGTNQLSRLTSDVASQVSAQQAQLLLDEQARRSGQQLAAGQQAIRLPFEQAQALQGLAGGLGSLAGQGTQYGSTLANLNLQQAQQLQGLGSYLQQLQQQRAILPLDIQFQLANLIKSGNTSDPSLGAFQRFGGGLESLGKGINALQPKPPPPPVGGAGGALV